MGDLDEFDLGTSSPGDDEEPTPTRVEDDSRKARLWIAGAAVGALILATAGYLWLGRSPAVPVASPSAAPPPTASPAPTPAVPPTPSELPPLAESDALVRELAQALSSHPLFAAWLGAQGLVGRVAAAVVAILEGGPLHQLLPFLAPQGAFSVVEREGRTFVDPQSYARYDAITAAVTSIDSAGAVAVMRRLEPLLDAACRELGQQTRFAPLLERAAHRLLATPTPAGDVLVRRVMRARVSYAYARPELEALSPAEKHLLRMGPQNGQKIRAKLRELLVALSAFPTTSPSPSALPSPAAR